MPTHFRPLAFIRLPGVANSIRLDYSPDVCPSYHESVFLESDNARRVKVEHKLQESPKDRLYWDFIAHTSRSKLPLTCMRVYYKRRWSNAFREALKNNGFDVKGRPLSTSSEWTSMPSLQGTLSIQLHNAPLWEKNDHSAMVQQSNMIVKGLIELTKDVQQPRIRAVRGRILNRPS